MGKVYGGPAQPSIPVKMDGVDYKPKTEAPPTIGKSTERLDATRPQDITRAAQILREGGTVAFPTETVYGLGANALDPAAIAKIFTAKQRPAWDPLIVHISDRAMLSLITQPFGSAPTQTVAPPNEREAIAHSPQHHVILTLSNAKGKDPCISPLPVPDPLHVSEPLPVLTRLTEAFWPGPLTLLLPRTHLIPDAVTAARPLVGVRMPAHPVALSLIRQAGIPIAAPSANRFGHTSPTTAAHVLADLDGRIDAILDGGSTEVGLESTVAEVASDRIILYRPGAVTAAMLESISGLPVESFAPAASSGPPESLPSPGVGLRHYAPKARLVLIENPEETREIFDLLADNFQEGLNPPGVMLPDNWPAQKHGLTFAWGPWGKKEVLAHRLFEGLRNLDDRGATVILCPLPSEEGLGDAIRDRLQKAARP